MKLPGIKKTKSGHTLYLHTPASGKPVYVTIPGSERPTTLNAEEQGAWEFAFREAKNRLKYGNLRADAYAWRQLQKQFPRLQEFDGVQREVR